MHTTKAAEVLSTDIHRIQTQWTALVNVVIASMTRGKKVIDTHTPAAADRVPDRH